MLVYPTFTLPFCTWMLMSYFKKHPDRAGGGGADRRLRAARGAVPDRAAAGGPGHGGGLPLLVHPGLERVPLRLVFISSRESQTVTVGLALMQGEDVFYWGKMMAGALLTALPPGHHVHPGPAPRDSGADPGRREGLTPRRQESGESRGGGGRCLSPASCFPWLVGLRPLHSEPTLCAPTGLGQLVVMGIREVGLDEMAMGATPRSTRRRRQSGVMRNGTVGMDVMRDACATTLVARVGAR